MTTNPFVGPRSFETGEVLYGRDRELRTLSALLIAERIVLMHSPSGAGKTSLLRAGLIPRLIEENFKVLPIIRVNVDPPPDLNTNRYILSTLVSLEEGFPVEERLPLAELACLSLDDYLNQRAIEKDTVLVFDQFEEILTISAADREGKLVFFNQLGTALRNKTRWALFSMREDYLGAMAVYARPIPNRLATRFRLDLLGADAAIQAIQKPAKSTGVDFTTPAARKLVDDLRRVQVQLPDGSMETQLGLYVEPVQLQVVCFRLWEGKDPNDKEIDENDLAGVGDVNQSLAEYYALSVAKVAEASGIPERSIREWFERKLITPEGIRGQVRRGAEMSDGLPNSAVRNLEDAHIIRAEQRAGQTWYELSHDRLIEPVREDNRKWFSVHLSLFQQQAVLWSQQGKSDGLLLGGKELEKAEVEVRSLHLTPDEQAFLDACRRLREREQRDRRQRQFIIAGLVASLVLLVVAIFFGVRANAATLDAQDKAAAAQTSQADASRAESIAVTNEAEAEIQKAKAEEQKVNAEAASRRALSGQLALASKSVVTQYPQRAQLLALEALKINLSAGEPVTSIAEEALRAANAQVNGRGLPGFSRQVSFLEFTRDNQWMMAGSIYSGEFHGWKLSEIDQPGYLFFETNLPPGDETTLTPYFSSQQRWFVIELGNETRLWLMSTLKAGAEPYVFEGSVSFLKDEYSLLEFRGDQTILWRFDPQNMPEKTSFGLEGVYVDLQSDLTTVITSGAGEGYLAWDTTKTPPQSTRIQSLPEPAAEEIVLEEQTEESQQSDVWESIPRKGFEDDPVIFATSPNQQWHAEGAFGGSLRLWNLIEEQKYQLGEVFASHLEFSTDGRWVVSGANLWQLKDGLPAGVPIRFSEQVFDVVFSPDSRWLLVVGGGVRLVELAKVSENAENASTDLDISGNSYYFLFFSPDSHWLVGGGVQDTALWDLANPQITPSLFLPQENLTDIAFFPDDKYVVGLKTSNGPGDYFPGAPALGSQIWIWDVSPQTYNVTQVGERKFDVPSQVSENGIWLIARNGEPDDFSGWKTTKASGLWDLRCIVENTSCKPFVMELPSGINPFGDDVHFDFSRGSRYLTSSISNGATDAYHIWDLQKANGVSQSAPILVYDSRAKYITSMPVWYSIQEITRRIYLFGGGGGGGGGEPGSYKVDYGIELFNPSDGGTSLQSLILRGHEDPVGYQLTSPSGRWTVTISEDSIKLWDLTVLQKDSFASPVNLPLEYLSRNIGFTMDERWLVFQTEEKLEFVPLHLDDLMAYGCRSVGRNFIINEWQRYFAGEPYRKACENLPEHQSVEIELRPTPTPLPAVTATADQGFTPTPGQEATPTRPPGSSQITYIVKAGDTLSSIASSLNTDVETLIEENNIDDPDFIQVGQVLIHYSLPTPTATP
jgi:WD40 repeat protein